ncbi:hypothetical protein BB558_001011 [Smittium angustum]|uniref:Uncharacterized protein n=1 Tax=Smittium angustum TaxID=133377 RepID=A0A2U1JCT5_SMIAN|nr:hypothetical protein BB558_001011 [Smittium angustum]
MFTIYRFSIYISYITAIWILLGITIRVLFYYYERKTPYIRLADDERNYDSGGKSIFELIDESTKKNLKNAASITNQDRKLPKSLNKIVNTDNYKRNMKIIFILSSIQCGLLWFLSSTRIANPHHKRFILGQSYYLIWGIYWTIFQIHILFKFLTKSHRSHTSYKKDIISFWELGFLSLFFIDNLFQLIDRESDVATALNALTFSFTIGLHTIILQTNRALVQKRLEKRPVGIKYEGSVYTGNDELPETPETGSSIANMLSFMWLNHLMEEAYRVRLGYIDLYKLSKFELPGYCWKRFHVVKQIAKNSKILSKLFKTFLPELVTQSILIVFISVLKFSGPYFLGKIVNLIDDETSDIDVDTGFNYCKGLGVSGLVLLVMENQLLWIGRKISIRVRNILTCELVDKSLRMGIVQSKRKYSNDNTTSKDVPGTENAEKIDDSDDKGMIMNLITVDVNKLVLTSAYLHYSILLLSQAVIGMLFLYKLMGLASLSGVLVMVFFYQISKKLFKYIMIIQGKMYSISDKRLAAIGEMIGGIKTVKLFGWESKFISKISKLRNEQLKMLWRVFQLTVVNWIGLSLTPIFVLFCTFWVYTVVMGKEMNAEIAFTSIAIFNILKIVFETIPWIFTQSIGSIVSLNRIQEYLDQEEVQLLNKRVTWSNKDLSIGFHNATLAWKLSSQESQTYGQESITKPNNQVSTISPIEGDSNGNPGINNDTESVPNQIDIENTKAHEFILENLNISFPVGQVSLLSGPVGSGKSSLLRALVGEMQLIEGQINIPVSGDGNTLFKVGYVPQEPWLRNASVRENILFGQKYDQERYETVLYSTALKPDLRMLSEGDLTMVGERGVSLSGGQKQRVSLARALYSDSKTILIDDCLSAVDSHTASHILEHCFTNPLFVSDRTIVISTHHIQLCLPSVSWVVLMRDGKVVVQGPPSEATKHPEFEGIVAAITTKKDKKRKIRPRTNKKYLTEDEYNTQNSIESNNILIQSENETTSNNEIDVDIVDETNIDSEEKRETGRVKLDVWVTYYKASGGFVFWIIIMIFAVLFQLVSIYHNYWIKIWVSPEDLTKISAINVSFQSEKSAFGNTYLLRTIAYGQEIVRNNAYKLLREPFQLYGHGVIYYLVIYLIIGIVSCIIKQSTYYFIYTGSLKASGRVHDSILEGVVHAKPSFFDKTPIGQIINRFSRDMQLVDEEIMASLTIWIYECLEAFGVMAIVIYVAPQFLIVGVVIFSLYLYIAIKYLRATREIKRMEATTVSPMLSLIAELTPGLVSIRAFGKTLDYILETAKRVDAYNRQYYALWGANRWLSINSDVIGLLVTVFSAIMAVALKDDISPGLAGFTLSYALTFSMHLMWVVRYSSEVELSMNSVERISQYYKEKLPQEAPNVISNKRTPSEWPQSGRLVVSNLNVVYQSSSAEVYNDGNQVLFDVNFKIEPGMRVGVVGRTGAGKSTLVHALLRLVEPDPESKIILDGINVMDIGLEDLRQNVTIIPQDPMLFKGTIRYNLDLFDEYSDEAVWNALYQARLVSSPTLPNNQSIEADEQIELPENDSYLSLNEVGSNSHKDFDRGNDIGTLSGELSPLDKSLESVNGNAQVGVKFSASQSETGIVNNSGTNLYQKVLQKQLQDNGDTVVEGNCSIQGINNMDVNKSSSRVWEHKKRGSVFSSLSSGYWGKQEFVDSDSTSVENYNGL